MALMFLSERVTEKDVKFNRSITITIILIRIQSVSDEVSKEVSSLTSFLFQFAIWVMGQLQSFYHQPSKKLFQSRLNQNARTSALNIETLPALNVFRSVMGKRLVGKAFK